LMQAASAKRGWQVHAVTVDHRLRPEAADEAAFVARICANLAIPHETLIWDHGAISGNLMGQARRARYAMMAVWARATGIPFIILGHTANDQAETLLMGLARASGVDGLSGMRAAWTEGETTFVRPFLRITRDELRGFLRQRGASWLDDPTNENDDFQRIKAREAIRLLAPLGVTVAGLGRVVENLDMARGALVVVTADASLRSVHEMAGAALIGREPFHALALEVQHRLLRAALHWMSGSDYAPRGEAIDRLGSAILLGKTATLAGCRIVTTQEAIRIMREPRAVAGLQSATTAPWDHRWQLDGPDAPHLTVRALGADGLAQCPDWRATGIARDILRTTPAIWHAERLIAAPMAGLSQGWTAKIRQSLHAFILSH
jgi:tRNA(Ile)-lysidine synthase